MAEKVLMPQLGESVTEGTLSKWLVKVGDFVKKYDPICEVSTDKVNAEVPSSFTGKITEINVAEGDTVDVGTLICYIQAEGESNAAAASAKEQTNQSEEVSENITSSMKQRYSPAVLQLASEYGIDLSQVQGSGAAGRITRKDLLVFIEKGGEAPNEEVTVPQEPAVTEKPAQEKREAQQAKSSGASQTHAAQGDQTVPVSAVRRTIANRMVQSKQEAPHAWMMIECDVTSLVNYRNAVKDEFKKKEGINLTYLPFFIKAVVESLKEYPMLNSVWGNEQIIIKKAINISIAVATDNALFVPVIKDADQKSILGIAKSVDDLAARARDGKLKLEDMSEGTFTVNNTGSFGSVLSAPIINQPQAAILSVESIVKRPVVINNMIAIRDMVNLCLSLDHRVLDGLVCGRFLQLVKEKIESVGTQTKLY